MTLAEIIEAAAREGWHIRPPTLEALPIHAPSGELAGFYCPHPAGRGRMRVGPIYVLPEFRGQRLGDQAYGWAVGVPVVAYVHKDNAASARLHERLGFRQWYQTRGGCYWSRP